MNIKFNKGWIKKILLHKLKNLCNGIKSSKNPKNLKNARADAQVRLLLKNGCSQLEIYTSELLNLSVETN